MSTRLVNVDRETPMLLPVDLREWVADDDLAHFLVEAVGTLDLGAAVVNQRGSGSAQYPPGMLLAVLLYCYATGRFSSRQIERATYRDVAVRYLSGDTHPDHDTIATFRARNGELVRRAFVQVLLLAKELGLVQVGTVSLDGTKVLAAAARRQTRSQEQIQQELALLESQVVELLRQAEAADAQPAPDGTQLPAELARRAERRARLQAAQARLQAQAQQQAQVRQAEREAWRADQPGEPPRAGRGEPGPQATINLTDPDSAVLRTRQGSVQGYNAQLAVTHQPGGGLIVAARVANARNDRRQLASTVAAIPAEVGVPQAIVADTGYDNAGQIARVEQSTGALVYCAPQPRRQRLDGGPNRSRYPRTEWASQRMRERLACEPGQTLWRQRKTTVEPVIGIVKSVLGFRRFQLRGLPKVDLEWTLVSLAFNCKRLAARRAGR